VQEKAASMKSLPLKNTIDEKAVMKA